MRPLPLTNVAGDIFTAIGMLLLIVLVFVGAYYFTKMLGKRQIFRQKASTGKIETLDQVALGPDRSLVIVRTGGKVLLLGVTGQHVELICELDPEEFLKEEAEEKDVPKAPAFSSLFQDALKSWKLGSKEPKDQKDKKEGPHL